MWLSQMLSTVPTLAPSQLPCGVTCVSIRSRMPISMMMPSSSGRLLTCSLVMVWGGGVMPQAYHSTARTWHPKYANHKLQLLHIGDHRVGEARAAYLSCTGHEPGEVVGHGLVGDRPLQAGDNQIGGLAPTKVTQHQIAAQDHTSRVDLVEVGVLRRGAVGRLEDRMTGDIVDVRAWRNADSANLRRQRVAQVIAIQIQRRNHVEIVGPRQHLLQRDVRNRILDHNSRARLA